ncbi:MAG: hypothetical protein ABMA13_02315 [Chthoniobacteraceae bacterium]
MNLALADGRQLAARIEAQWLLCDGEADAAAPRDLLARNATLTPPLKLVVDRAGQPRLRAEWPIDLPADEALPQLAASLESSAPDVNAAELLLLAQAAGWSATQRNETLCAVQLDCDVHAIALLSARDGAVRAVIEVASLADASPVCAEAVAVLLLSVAGDVRFVRPVFAEGSAWLEAAFPVVPDFAALGEGLAALSVAFRIAGREAALLAGDEALASDFLSLRAEPAHNRNQTA